MSGISTFNGLNIALRGLTAQQRALDVTSHNIANVETPGYRARDVDFRAALQRAFSAAAPGGEGAAKAGVEADAAPPQVVVDRDAPVKVDGNSVDLDSQMARLSENAYRITALSRMLARHYDTLKQAINGAPR